MLYIATNEGCAVSGPGGQFQTALSPNPILWCPGWDLNPHTPYGIRDFKYFGMTVNY